MAKASPIPVVCALIEKAGTLLLAKRPAHKRVGGKWEFPGGQVEPGETAAAAIVREIREELGCSIAVLRELPHHIHRYEHSTIELIPHVCRLQAGSAAPTAIEHSAIAWVPPGDVAAYDLAPADIPVLADYLDERVGRG